MNYEWIPWYQRVFRPPRTSIGHNRSMIGKIKEWFHYLCGKLFGDVVNTFVTIFFLVTIISVLIILYKDKPSYNHSDIRACSNSDLFLYLRTKRNVDSDQVLDKKFFISKYEALFNKNDYMFRICSNKMKDIENICVLEK